MVPDPPRVCRAFAGTTQVAAGSLADVATRVKAFADKQPQSTLLVFDDVTGSTIELDLRGSVEDVISRLTAPATHRPGNRGLRLADPAKANAKEAAAPASRGRPHLGVVAREVTLLPRHWQWLSEQTGGASAALRRLVEEAKRGSSGKDRARVFQEQAYRFMSVMAGDLPGFEEATRALFAGNAEVFERCISRWPSDVCAQAGRMAARAFVASDE